jgi:tetratricopeptide (TPR) repeat protein
MTWRPLRPPGQYAAAEPCLARALDIREKALGPELPHTARSLNNLAELYASQGQYAAAEPLYRRALTSGEGVGAGAPRYGQ